MNDEPRAAMTVEYVRRRPRSAPLFKVFNEHAIGYFSKCGVRRSLAEIGDLGEPLQEQSEYYNYIVDGQHVEVGQRRAESSAALPIESWAGYGGRGCGDGDPKISKCSGFHLVDRDYAVPDTDRYPWLSIDEF
jgi:hypothetical protein